jgi:glycine/D-amino acid oxidase-like deaminating enzyme
VTIAHARATGPAVPPGGLSGRRLVIVGAGVAGSSLAWAAACAGADVTVLEASASGAAGASAAPVALINPHRGRTGSARPADASGARTVWRWAAALGALGLETGATRGGVLRAASDARQARAWARLDHVRHLAPGSLGPFRLPHGGFVVPDGGWLEPASWLPAMARAAGRSGATHVLNARAERIEGTAVEPRVVSSAGTFPADLVVLCLGASDPGDLPSVTVRRVAGEVVLTPHATLPHALAGGVYAAPTPSATRTGAPSNGPHLAVGGNHREGADLAARSEDARRLLDSLRWVLPTVGDEVAAVWTGIRARGADTEPVVRRLAPAVWWVGAFAGRGFLRAASTAEALVAEWSRPS